jgi:hypothetical protein
MSNLTPQPGPGFARQGSARTAFRVLGVVITGTALVFLLIGGIDFFGSVNSYDGPTKFWMFFVGLPMLGVGGWCLQAGFLGAGARYVSGEVSPVAKDTAVYLTDGKGLLNLGVRSEPLAAPAAGHYCRSCGTRNDADARFCDSCGTAMA